MQHSPLVFQEKVRRVQASAYTHYLSIFLFPLLLFLVLMLIKKLSTPRSERRRTSLLEVQKLPLMVIRGRGRCGSSSGASRAFEGA